MISLLNQLEGFFIETSEIDNTEAEMLVELSTMLNVIYLFREKTVSDARDSLHFIHCIDTEDSYNDGGNQAYGQVILEGQSLHFFTDTFYKWNSGGVFGYDTTYFKKQTFASKEVLNNTYTIFWEGQEICFGNESKNVTFKPLQGREYYYFQNENEVRERVQSHYRREDERWENMLASYVSLAHHRGKTNADILGNINSEGWNLDRIEKIIKS